MSIQTRARYTGHPLPSTNRDEVEWAWNLNEANRRNNATRDMVTPWASYTHTKGWLRGNVSLGREGRRSRDAALAHMARPDMLRTVINTPAHLVFSIKRRNRPEILIPVPDPNAHHVLHGDEYLCTQTTVSIISMMDGEIYCVVSSIANPVGNDRPVSCHRQTYMYNVRAKTWNRTLDPIIHADAHAPRAYKCYVFTWTI